MLCVAPVALEVVVAVTVEGVLEVAPPDELPEFIARLKLVLYVDSCTDRISGAMGM